MNDELDRNRTKARLEAACKIQAEELERVGKRPVHYCGECTNCRANYNADNEIISYHCIALSDDDAVYEITDEDEITKHGDWGYSVNDGGPCDWFDPKDKSYEEPYYENMADWLDDQPHSEYTITDQGEYRCGTVTTGEGGPHIWVDTRAKEVRGRWWSDTASAYVSSDTIAALDDALEEMYMSTRVITV